MPSGKRKFLLSGLTAVVSAPALPSGGAGGFALVVGVGNALFVPVNTVAPAITGTEAEGQTLTGTDGTWTGSPTSIENRWVQATTSGGDIVTSGGKMVFDTIISGATGANYTLQASDAGFRLFKESRATNAAGTSDWAQSNATGVIAAGWSPATISALAWGDETSIQHSGATVTAWNDRSGNGHHMTVSKGAPSYSATAYGGQPGVSFTAGDGLMTGTGFVFAANAAAFAFAVIRDDASSADARTANWIAKFDGNDYGAPSTFVLCSRAGTTPGTWQAYNGSVIAVTGHTEGSPHQLIVSFNGTTETLYSESTSASSGYSTDAFSAAGIAANVGFGMTSGKFSLGSPAVASSADSAIQTVRRWVILDGAFSALSGGNQTNLRTWLAG